jgi:3-oxoacyl-ACP reductase-like protein
MTVVLATAFPGYDPPIPRSNIRRRFVMSIFGDIMSAIFGRSAKAETPAAGTAGPAAPAAPSGAPPATPSASPAPSSAPGAAPAAPAAPVDVAAVLDALAKKNKQKLNWRKSIVDLMKLLDLDSSQTARKKLAEELNYSGDAKDSAKMNVWLHKQVMIKLAANGGKVPADLKD